VAELTVVIPTLGRPDKLGRVLARLDLQEAGAGAFEVTVVVDANDPEPEALDTALAGHSYPIRRLRAPRPGASAARNLGWREADTALNLFLDDDVLPERALIAEHLAWHERYPEDEVGVLGHVRWANELRVTPFMRWLEHGIQFDYRRIKGIEAGWGRFYTANASVKRSMVERAGGFEEEALPFGYEDLDLALRMRDLGFRLLYNRAAVAEHLHPMDIEFWKRRVARIAISERAFVRMHPEIPAYFYEMFTSAVSGQRARGRGARLAAFIPPWLPWLGPRVWSSVDAYYRQALAPHFLEAWATAAPPSAQGPAVGGGSRRSSSGPSPSGPK
jgi:GT2 family glycosyltransferase